VRFRRVGHLENRGIAVLRVGQSKHVLSVLSIKVEPEYIERSGRSLPPRT
jgi:hypothetical protein